MCVVTWWSSYFMVVHVGFGEGSRSKPPPVSDPEDPYSVKSTWAGAYRTCFSLTNRWVCYAQTYGAVMHCGSDHLKPVRFLSFYGFVMRRPGVAQVARCALALSHYQGLSKVSWVHARLSVRRS